MNIISKLISYIFGKLLPFVDRMTYMRYFDQPFLKSPKSSKENYYKLFEKAKANTYSIKDVDTLEKECGYSINKNWIDSLALQTQIVIKKSELNYAHGRVLYSVLRKYLSTLDKDNKSLNIIETGTARGFSALCMAKALSDSKFEGSICTLDVLPHFKKIFWNCISDHTNGSQSRNDLLSDWSDLSERYIIFLQGFAKHILNKIAFTRINFAFLDGSHTYEDVMFEFKIISKRQKKGDVVIFDDYNEENFPGIVKAIKFIAEEKKYEIKLIHNKNTHRDYAIAKKLFN